MSSCAHQALIVVFCLAAFAGAKAQTITTSAKFALLEDYDTGAVLFDKAADEAMAPASMSKLMVAELTFRELKEGRLHLDDKFHVSEYAWRTGGAPSHGSAMFLAVKSNVRVDDLLRGLIIESGNDAALVLAEGIAGSEQNFVGLMNKRAAELGLTHSHFTNAWGRSDPAERVSARDLASLARHIIHDYPEYYHYFSDKDFTWSRIHQLNRNPLLNMNIGADGLKTGDTAESGYGVVGSAVQDGQRLILVVNGYKTAAERAEDARRLLNWGFRGFDVRVFYQPGDTVGRAEVYGGAEDSVALTPLAPVKVYVPKVGGDKMTAAIVYSGPLAAPVEAGRKLGELRIYNAGALVMSAPLETKAAVAKGPLASRAADAAWELSKDWLRRQWKRR
ncbi:MAG TPA: D-alanyl-D-alanine carboxypeptidase family protein [Roseiarcus sp.]|nr:D-alanyl-D-alanine carboxypeptidase family protein [Roseiarcus sp.]